MSTHLSIHPSSIYGHSSLSLLPPPSPHAFLPPSVCLQDLSLPVLACTPPSPFPTLSGATWDMAVHTDLEAPSYPDEQPGRVVERQRCVYDIIRPQATELAQVGHHHQLHLCDHCCLGQPWGMGAEGGKCPPWRCLCGMGGPGDEGWDGRAKPFPSGWWVSIPGGLQTSLGGAMRNLIQMCLC